jgi:hypothetical protein
MGTEFLRDVGTPEELRAYLTARGGSHTKYMHYTNFDGLIGMVRDGFFRLSKGDRMNDRQEPRMGDRAAWTHTFIGSFAFGQSENMALWGLYGLPWEDAVCISIPKKYMNRWLDGIIEVYNTGADGIYSLLDAQAEVLLNDVAYLSEEPGKPPELRNSHQHGYKKLDEASGLGDVKRDPRLTGFIKHDAWRYEKEVRLHVRCPAAGGLDRLAVKLPDDVIDGMTVVFGPWAKADAMERLKARIKELRGKPPESAQSGYAGLVDYKTACGYCVQREYKRREEAI